MNFKVEGGIKKTVIGKGAMYVGDNIQDLLNAAKARKETMVEKELSFIRRKTNEGQTYFINNRSEKAVNAWVAINSKALSVALFNPMTSKNGLANWRTIDDGIQVYLQLQPFESVIVQTYNSKKTGSQYVYSQINGDPKEIAGEWSVEFLSGGPVLPKKINTAQLKSWTEFEGDEVKFFSGTANYSINFQKAKKKSITTHR